MRHYETTFILRPNLGEDQFGIYTDYQVKGVAFRMRWIWSGTFMMGSPDDEPEQNDNETRHEVTLTRGFWLAETTCTQALWQAVMKNNPSNFKGEALPVDNVSWEDCQTFLEQINRFLPGLNLGLPTEAQWEWACRAGTDSPLNMGDFDPAKPFANLADQARAMTFVPQSGTPMAHEALEGSFEMMTPTQVLRELRLTMQALDITGRVCFDHVGNYWKNSRGQLLFSHSYQGYRFPEEQQAVLDLIDDGLKVGGGER